VVAAWQQLGLPLRIVRPKPVTLTDLSRAHDRAYVLGVLAGRIQNGFGNTLPEIAATLPWTSGSLLSAAEHAVRTAVLQVVGAAIFRGRSRSTRRNGARIHVEIATKW
jgi:acetoin utilization deacetylase AcuC-like enzyme